MERTDFEQWKSREVARLLALVETERRYYQEMVAALPVALVVLSADRAIVSANRAFRQTFGVRSEDLRRRTIEQIIPSAQLIERIRDTHISGASQPADLYLDIDGRPLRVSLLPIRNWDDEGELETLLMVEDLRTIGSMLETMGFSAGFPMSPSGSPPPTARERSPEAQAPVETATEPTATAPEESSIQAAVVESIGGVEIPAILWQADAATLGFTLVRGAAEQLLGFPLSHWTETLHFFSERIHPEDRAAAMSFYEAAIARVGDASAEFRAVTASGAIIWCRETIRVPEPRVPEPDSQCEPESRTITGVLTDITLRKQLEQQLLTGQRHDALQGLSSRLAHDLNNPLMIITGYTEEMLQTLSAQDPTRDDVQQILGATERISGITSHLLAFARKTANPPQQVELGALLASMEERIAKAAGENVTVEIAGSSGPVWVSADPAQIEEIILALVSGAREDTQERSRVTIGCEIDAITERMEEASLKPGSYARITIHDNGRSVTAAKRATIFESVLAGKDPEKSAGPGLARAYGIVREWNGDIAFGSDPLRGSTFMLYLPHVPPEPPPVEVPTEAVAAVERVAEPAVEPAPVIPVGPMRETILLVEDEAGIRALVRKILARERYRVLEAASGEEALSIAQAYEDPIHLLLTDVMLPGMGGRYVAESLRSKLPELRVVYVSGYTDDEEVRAGWFPPGSLFLEKPFTLSALVTKVRESLDAQ